MSAIALERPVVIPLSRARRVETVGGAGDLAAWDYVVDTRGAAALAQPVRRPLQAVPDYVDDIAPAVDRSVGAPRRRGVRLTRRGRLARTLAGFALAVLVVLMVLARLGGDPQLRIDHATTVLPGQTLSDVAHAQLPGLPLEDAVAAVQVANGLNSTELTAGQSLLIPAA